MAEGPVQEFDLASMSTAQAKGDRPLKYAGYSIAAIGATAVAVAIGVSAADGASVRAIVVLVAGLVFLVAGLVIARVSAKNIRRIRLEPTALEFVLSSGSSVRVGWDDPALRLELLDRRRVAPSSPALAGRVTPFTLGSRAVGASTDIPMELYDAILGEAQRRGKTIQVNHLGPGDFAGAVQSFITAAGRR